jgi:ribosomal protein S18 acetylase RimI-like enzyme
MATLEKRQMMSEDIQSIKKVDDDYFSFSPWSLDYFGKLVKNSENSLVFCLEGSTVGYVFTEKDSSYLLIRKMAVFPDHQRKGFGTEIIRCIQKTSEVPIRFGVRQSNEGAIGLYEKTDFQRVAFECYIGDKKYSNEDPRIEMVWTKPESSIAIEHMP